MDLDTSRVRELLDARDKIDVELQSIFTNGKERKPQKCGRCGEEGHNMRNCTKPE